MGEQRRSRGRRRSSRASRTGAQLLLARQAVARLALERRRAVGEHLGRAARGPGASTSSSVASASARAEEAIPPPRRAISSYGTPVTFCSYSSARQPANGRCVWQSTRPGTIAPPDASITRSAPGSSSSAAITPSSTVTEPGSSRSSLGRPQVRQAVLGRQQHLRGAAHRASSCASGSAPRAARPRRAPPGSRRRRGGSRPSRDRPAACGGSARPASGVPSATITWPACSDLPMPTPPPWWNETQLAPVAVFTSALRIGQSATASEPSRIASVSRCGEATEPASRWSRPITIGAAHRARRDQLVEAQPGEVALAVAEPADPRGQALEAARARAPARSSGGCGPARRTGRGSRRR